MFTNPHRTTRGRTLLGVPAALLTSLVGVAAPAAADVPTVLRFDSTGITCEAGGDGAPVVNLWLHRDVAAGEAEAGVEVYTPDGEGHLASGHAADFVLADGRISATYPLLTEEGEPAGTVTAQGRYAAAGAPVTNRERFRYARNGVISGVSTYTPLSVEWTTLEVGGFSLSGLACSGDRFVGENRVTRPHRVVTGGEVLALEDGCAPAPLTGVTVQASEAGTSLMFAMAGWSGFTNLDLSGAGDTQSLDWWAEGAEEPVIGTASATLTVTGTPRTRVEHAPGSTVRMRVRPAELAFRITLPDGSTASGTCGARIIDQHVVAEETQG